MIYKMNKDKLLAFLCLFLFIGKSLLFCEEYAGTTAFQYLKADVGARTMGMGGAFAGVADDISAMRYNPAGLRMLLKPEISATHMEWIDDLRIEYFAYGRPYGVDKAIGFNFFMMTSPDIMGHDSEGFQTHVLKYEQMYATLGWATRLDRYDNFLFGLNGISIPLSVVASFFIVFFYRKVLISYKLKSLNLDFYFCLFVSIYIFYKINRYSSFGNDAITHLCFFYLIRLILTDNNFKQLSLVILLCVFIFLNKNTYLLIFLFPVSLAYSLIVIY